MAFTITWLLQTSRLLGVCLASPIFTGVPWRMRAALAAALALGMPHPADPSATVLSAEQPWPLAAACGAELGLGMALAWGLTLVVGALRAAGSLIADQMGLALGGTVNTIDDTPALGSFSSVLAVAALVALDAHHAVLRIAGESFRAAAPGGLDWESIAALPVRLLESAGPLLFEAACVYGLPVLGVLSLAAVAQALLSRLLPEADFFALGPPLRAAVGLAVMLAALPSLVGVSRAYFDLGVQSAAEMILGK